ncbi:hypothetical protein [Methylobacterium gnaphalii]|uniref:Uncharacterized protein n=1 Tax=Methylobacterium gnaphalii TaxID=1010610 RepID=A0A512JIU1_9HYPH|nr:hypothetical protein [Methylobacterium gnaphalii]GEP09854.1 hypothetical protein MGN01_16990 [Methylobacterium gnaphalii]GJD67231.1 hypothetical protein MMMDOFMJ_0145 [Methylobacterium gnaphalii]GLS49883.1 hypothetical protein GCM10007885_27350 [Methylobacterium gnaphalii]
MIRFYVANFSGKALRGVAYGLTWIGGLAVPVLFASRWCLDRAREWDPRLWQRGEHTDLHPPPGA